MSRNPSPAIGQKLRDAAGGVMVFLAFGLVLTLILAPRETFVSPGYAETAATWQATVSQAGQWQAGQWQKGAER